MSGRIWTIASGKGGTGKSFITSSLGITLARSKKKVLLADFDFSGSSLHTTLGESLKPMYASDYLSGEKCFSDVVLESQIPGLSYIQFGQSRIDSAQLRQVIADGRRAGFQEILFDVSHAFDPISLELMDLAENRLAIVTPEPASIEKTYHLVEQILGWTLENRCPEIEKMTLHRVMKNYKKDHRPGRTSLKFHLQTEVGIDWNIVEDRERKPMHLLLNQVRSERDGEIATSIQTICKHYYNLRLATGTPLSFDNAAWQSARKAEAVLLKYPFSPLAAQFHALARSFVTADLLSQSQRAVV